MRIRQNYRFIHVIEGIDLQDITGLTLGDVTVFRYTTEHLETLLRYCEERNEKDFFDVTIFSGGIEWGFSYLLKKVAPVEVRAYRGALPAELMLGVETSPQTRISYTISVYPRDGA